MRIIIFIMPLFLLSCSDVFNCTVINKTYEPETNYIVNERRVFLVGKIAIYKYVDVEYYKNEKFNILVGIKYTNGYILKRDLTITKNIFSNIKIGDNIVYSNGIIKKSAK